MIDSFKYWVQKVLPTVYDDSLSYYELLNNVVIKLNQIITEFNELESNVVQFQADVTNEISEFEINTNNSLANMMSTINGNYNELTTLYNELKSYVDSYFDNLDVQEEINIKLDEMVDDGTLANLINDVLFTELNNKIDRIYVNVKDFGCVGDGITDDTVNFKLAAASGYRVMCERNKVYKLTDTIVLTNDLLLNNSVLNFELSSQIPAIRITNDNVVVSKGEINVVGSAMGGSGYALSCVTVGNQGTGAGQKNFEISDLTLSSNRNDAGGLVTVFGDCYNFTIRNINCKSSDRTKNCINIEWGGTSAGTGHPHNFTITDIYVGEMTQVATTPLGFGYAVWLSGCFNATVRNVFAEKIFGLVSVVAGDNAGEYTPTKYLDSVGKGFYIDNIQCKNIYGYGVRIVGKGTYSVNYLHCNAKVTNMYVKADSLSANNVYGFSLEYCKGVNLEKFIIDGCYVGYSTGAYVDFPVVQHGRILNNKIYGLAFGSSGGVCTLPILRDVQFVGNNTNNGTTVNNACILLTNCLKASVDNCTFGETGVVDNQKYCVYATSACINPRLTNNYVFTLASGGIAFVMDIGSNATMNAEGINNDGVAGLTLYGGSPIFVKFHDKTRLFSFSTIPISGTFNVGDKMYYTNPTTSGYIGAVCTVAGSPGTWKNYGQINNV